MLVGSAGRAAAQTYFVPFAGANISGDASCAENYNCADSGLTLGASYGYFNEYINDIFGFDEEFGYTKNLFRRDGPGARSRVITLMTNITAGKQLGLVRPYGLIGVGFIQTKILTTGQLSTNTEDDNDFGWNAGGGVVLSYGRIGIRGDVRFFRGFHERESKGFPVDEKIKFGRATIGLVVQGRR